MRESEKMERGSRGSVEEDKGEKKKDARTESGSVAGFDLASLKRTKGMKAKRQWEGGKVKGREGELGGKEGWT